MKKLINYLKNFISILNEYGWEIVLITIMLLLYVVFPYNTRNHINITTNPLTQNVLVTNTHNKTAVSERNIEIIGRLYKKNMLIVTANKVVLYTEVRDAKKSIRKELKKKSKNARI